MRRSSFITRFSLVALAGLAASCSGGLGDFCQSDDACNSGLVCLANGPGQRGVCAYPPSGDAAADATSDSRADARDSGSDSDSSDASSDATDASSDTRDAAGENAPDAGVDGADATPDGADAGTDIGLDAPGEAGNADGAGDAATG